MNNKWTVDITIKRHNKYWQSIVDFEFVHTVDCIVAIRKRNAIHYYYYYYSILQILKVNWPLQTFSAVLVYRFSDTDKDNDIVSFRFDSGYVCVCVCWKYLNLSCKQNFDMIFQLNRFDDQPQWFGQYNQINENSRTVCKLWLLMLLLQPLFGCLYSNCCIFTFHKTRFHPDALRKTWYSPQERSFRIECDQRNAQRATLSLSSTTEE